MKHLPKLIILLMLGLIPMQVLGNNFTGFFSPNTIALNDLSAATFDPENVAGQTYLTTLTVTNISSTAHILRLKVKLTWNDKQILETEFQSRQPIEPSESLVLTNGELFTNASSTYFTLFSGGYTGIDDIIKVDPTLKQALLSGYFPDGTIKAEVKMRAVTSAQYDEPAHFTIIVKNTGDITLLSPGQKLGGTPPQVNLKPVNFMWNALNTGFNKAWITIREFPENLPPTQTSVALSGTLFYETPDDAAAQDLINNFMFSDFLPFNDGCYYAWQITLDRYTQHNPVSPSKRPRDSESLKSEWYVFQYVTDGTAVDNESELKTLLMSLNDDAINVLFSQGFNPAGNVILNGRNYSGHEAVRLLREIIQKDVDITVGN